MSSAPVFDSPDLDGDVIVVGGGISGMTAAKELHDAGLKVLVLEANDRVGGRTWSGAIDGGPIDFGGMFIGTTHHASIELGVSLGLEKVRARPAGKMRWRLNGAVLDAADGGYPEARDTAGASLGERLSTSFGLLDELAAAVGKDAPWDSPLASELDAVTASTWMAENLPDAAVRQIHDVDFNIVLGADPTEVSMLYWAFYIAQCENMHALQVTANDSLWIGGAGQITERIADRLDGQVVLGAPVNAIEHHSDSVTVQTPRGAFRASRVVLAMPPSAANRIQITPPLPVARRQLETRAPMGRYMKVQTRYDRQFWLEDGLSGEIFDADLGTFTLDVTRPGDDLATLVTFIGGKHYDSWMAQDAAARQADIVDVYTSCLGPAATTPVVYNETNWTEQPYALGGPVTVMPTGLLSTVGAALREPVGQIHFAGTEAAPAWNGYMEGAVRAGQAAAAQISAALPQAALA